MDKFKVQRENSKTMVLCRTIKEARNIAKEDSKKNKTILNIYERKGSRWYFIDKIGGQEK